MALGTLGTLLGTGAVNCAQQPAPTSGEHGSLRIRSFESVGDAGGADASCSCIGAGPGGATIATNVCGQVVCGEDDYTWICGPSGFQYQGASCGSDSGSGCLCTGAGLDGGSVTATACGQVVCGEDENTYVCTTSGFQFQGEACGSNCNCRGVGIGGTFVDTNVCGQVVCGEDGYTYACTGSGFRFQGVVCVDAGPDAAADAGSDAAADTGSDAGCLCIGTDISGAPVSTDVCGQVTCGPDGYTWSCTQNGFLYQGVACGSDASAEAGCLCAGMGLDGGTVTANACGQVVCGQDAYTWTCGPSGFQYQGEPCGTNCDCRGAGIGGTFVDTDVCGQVVCGEDGYTYACTGSGFRYQGEVCVDAGADASADAGSDAPPDTGSDAGCLCFGTDISGAPVSTDVCGQVTCGPDGYTWSCTQNGFLYQGVACSSDASAEAGCLCTGMGLDGGSVTANACGQVVCGEDQYTYVCGPSGFQYQGDACGNNCNCRGVVIGGTFVDTNVCGQVVCGADAYTYVCTGAGFRFVGTACSADAGDQ